MQLTLIKPGEPLQETVYNLDFCGDGMYLRIKGVGCPEPLWHTSNQEAKEAMIRDAYELMESGYRLYTGDGITG